MSDSESQQDDYDYDYETSESDEIQDEYENAIQAFKDKLEQVPHHNLGGIVEQIEEVFENQNRDYAQENNIFYDNVEFCVIIGFLGSFVLGWLLKTTFN
jgi:hypothetical protein